MTIKRFETNDFIFLIDDQMYCLSDEETMKWIRVFIKQFNKYGVGSIPKGIEIRYKYKITSEKISEMAYESLEKHFVESVNDIIAIHGIKIEIKDIWKTDVK